MGHVFQMLEGAVETGSAGFDEGDRSKGEPFIKDLYTSLTVFESEEKFAGVRMTEQQRRELGEHLLKVNGPRVVVKTFTGDEGEAPVLVQCSRCGDFLTKEIGVTQAFGCPRCKCPVKSSDPEGGHPWPHQGTQVRFVRGELAEMADKLSQVWYPLRSKEDNAT